MVSTNEFIHSVVYWIKHDFDLEVSDCIDRNVNLCQDITWAYTVNVCELSLVRQGGVGAQLLFRCHHHMLSSYHRNLYYTSSIIWHNHHNVCTLNLEIVINPTWYFTGDHLHLGLFMVLLRLLMCWMVWHHFLSHMSYAVRWGTIEILGIHLLITLYVLLFVRHSVCPARLFLTIISAST